MRASGLAGGRSPYVTYTAGGYLSSATPATHATPSGSAPAPPRTDRDVASGGSRPKFPLAGVKSCTDDLRRQGTRGPAASAAACCARPAPPLPQRNATQRQASKRLITPAKTI